MISASTGEQYSSCSAQELLFEVVTEILYQPLNWSAFLSSLAAELSGFNVVLTPIGPTNCASYLFKELGLAGVHISSAAPPDVPPKLTDSHNSGDIAVVGMAGRFPGGDTLEAFWKVLEDGLDLHRKVCSRPAKPLNKHVFKILTLLRYPKIDSMSIPTTILPARSKTVSMTTNIPRRVSNGRS
jgi:hypothetical protein